jgi:hypothetical protein
VRAKGFLKDTESWEIPKGRKPSKELKEGRAKYLEVCKRYRKFAPQVDEFHGGTLGHS